MQVILAVLLYTAIAGFFNYLDELRPIFASAPVREGGLGLTTDVLAWSLGFGGIAFMLYSYWGECHIRQAQVVLQLPLSSLLLDAANASIHK